MTTICSIDTGNEDIKPFVATLNLTEKDVMREGALNGKRDAVVNWNSTVVNVT